MEHRINGCIEALNICHKEGYYDKAPEAEARLIELYEAIVAPEERNQLGKNEHESSLSWEYRLLKLFRDAGLTVEEQWEHVRRVEDEIIFNHLVLDIIERLAEANRIKECLYYIEKLKTLHIFKEENQRYTGYRVLLKHAAERADAASFFRLLPLSEPSKERHDIDICKAALVGKACEAHGWEAALELCRHRKIGDKFVLEALRPLAGRWTYEEMKRLFEERPELDVQKHQTRLKLLVETYCASLKRSETGTSERFDEVFELADKTDPAMKWGDVRLRDGLLMDIGLASHNPVEVERCRKAIKNNGIKKELKWWLDELGRQRKLQK